MAMWRLSVAFAAGVAAAQLTSFAPFAYPLDRLFLTCLAVCLALGSRTAAVYALGIGLYLAHAAAVIESRVDPGYTGDNILTQVRVLGFPDIAGDGATFLVEPIDDARLPPRTRLSWREPPARPRGGDTWELVVRLKAPRGNLNPGGFDSEAWLFRERIGATGYVVASRRNRLLGAGQGGVLLAVRQALDRRLTRVVSDSRSAAVLKAISIGVRHELSDAQWERYARTGTSHLMAISGLHVGLAAAASYGLSIVILALFRVRRDNHALSLAVAIVFAGAYALLSGSGVPAVRAFIMLVAASLALIRTRSVTGFSAWAAALAVVTAYDPLTAGNAGYLLSFAAVLALLWLARQRAAGKVRLVIRMQWVLLLGLLPLTVLLFDRYAPAAPVINLVVVPLFSVVTVPATLLGLILGGPFEFAGNALLRIAAWTVEQVDVFLAWDAWPAGEASAGLGAFGGLCVLGTIAWAFLPRGWPGRWLSVPALIALAAWQPARPPPGCFTLAAVDIGQGQAIVVETLSFTLVYDTGPAWPGGRSAATNTLLPYLAHRGIRYIDTTVISHSDVDHAGGLAVLAAAVPLGRQLAGEALRGFHAAPADCHSARAWQRDGVRFAFIDAGARGQGGNNASCVLEISTGTHRALLTGDIERRVEALLVDGGALEPADVVTVPHHGSRTSSSTAFVAAVDADYAIVSAGWQNRWGFPKANIVRRWTAQGATVLSTSDAGAVRVQICRDGVDQPKLERLDRRRIWHGP